jgi:hypothetical protein
MMLPIARGPRSAALIAALRHGDLSQLPRVDDVPTAVDVLADDDVQLALWICYELHYRGFDEVPDAWEWHPDVIGMRAGLERAVLAALRREVQVVPDERPVAQQLTRLVEEDDGPALSRFLQQRATREQVLEFVIHRSIYQLKEADPHTWAVPRLSGRAKCALMEIQLDEYGAGDAAAMHSELYRVLLHELGSDDGYGAYVDVVPGVTLALSNVMSLFGLHRQLRGALVGHLAAYEMTSSAPCRRYGRALRRIGAGERACAFFDVHVTADALHEQLIAHDVCGTLAQDEPALLGDILFGAAACLHLEKLFAVHLLDSWDRGGPSLADSPPTRVLVG